MAREINLGSMPIGSGFAIPDAQGNPDIVGILRDRNDCAAKVRFRYVTRGGGGVKDSEWSLMSMVVPCNDVDLTEIQPTLTCACGKVCSSTSGYTLHRKNCRIAAPLPTNDEAALAEES